MTLKPGYSRETFEHNYAQMKREHYPHAQALAASFSEARKSFFDHFPNGALPLWLTPKGGERMKNPIPRDSRKSLFSELDTIAREYGYSVNNDGEILLRENSTSIKMSIVKNRVRYEGRGKLIFSSPLSTAKSGFETFLKEYWYAEKKRRPNPVPPSSRALSNDRLQRIEMAGNLYTRFTGHDADEVVEVDKPVLPDVMLVVGDIDGVLYTTVRDGKTEKYIHKFKKNCRPLFTVSPDGKQIFMLGGSYDFTERGIVDKT